MAKLKLNQIECRGSHLMDEFKHAHWLLTRYFEVTDGVFTILIASGYLFCNLVDYAKKESAGFHALCITKKFGLDFGVALGYM